MKPRAKLTQSELRDYIIKVGSTVLRTRSLGTCILVHSSTRSGGWSTRPGRHGDTKLVRMGRSFLGKDEGPIQLQGVFLKANGRSDTSPIS